MFPVPAAPKVKVWLAVVARVPVAVRYRPPGTPAEILAVGVPLATFTKANLAELVAVLPRRRSFCTLSGERALLFNCQKLTLEALDQVSVPLLSVRIEPDAPFAPGQV
jgi:hypothetical protein